MHEIPESGPRFEASEPASKVRLGRAVVRLASREVEGPGGTAVLEPRVLQVLMALADHLGEVVARRTLLATCWPGQVVGEDALNRAIAELRKGLRIADDDLRIDTVPKNGYRLRAPTADAPPLELPAPAPSPSPGATMPASRARRRILAGAVAAASASAAWIGWRSTPRPNDRRAGELIAQAVAILREDRWGPVDPLMLLHEAVRLRPRDARAYGLRALALRDVAQSSGGDVEFRAIADCRIAASQALALDPDQPDAQLALATIEPFYTDWLGAEQRLAVLSRRTPDHEATLCEWGELLASTGRAPEAHAVKARLMELEPVSPAYAAETIFAAWCRGDVARMDDLADRALAQWPENAGVWRARMLTLGFSGRPAQALDMMERNGGPGDYPPLIGEAYQAAFRAHAARMPINAAVEAAMAAGAKRQSSAIHAIPILASLGATREAFAVADAYFLHKGPFQVPLRFGASEPSAREMRDRATAMLFVPPARSLWPLPAFESLCRRIGLWDYWRAAGVAPHLLGTHPFAIR